MNRTLTRMRIHREILLLFKEKSPNIQKSIKSVHQGLNFVSKFHARLAHAIELWKMKCLH